MLHRVYSSGGGIGLGVALFPKPTSNAEAQTSPDCVSHLKVPLAGQPALHSPNLVSRTKPENETIVEDLFN